MVNGMPEAGVRAVRHNSCTAAGVRYTRIWPPGMLPFARSLNWYVAVNVRRFLPSADVPTEETYAYRGVSARAVGQLTPVARIQASSCWSGSSMRYQTVAA